MNKFHNDLKSQKIEGSPAVIHNYLSYLEDAYLAFPVLLFDESLRRVQSNPRKIYLEKIWHSLKGSEIYYL